MRSLVEVLHHLLVRIVDAGSRLGRSDLGVAKLQKVIEERRGNGVVCKRCTRQECEQTAQVCLPRRRWEVSRRCAEDERGTSCTRAHVRAHVRVRVSACACACAVGVRGRDRDVARRTDHGSRRFGGGNSNLRPPSGRKGCGPKSHGSLFTQIHLSPPPSQPSARRHTLERPTGPGPSGGGRSPEREAGGLSRGPARPRTA